MNKKTIIIIIVCALLAGALIGGLGVMLYNANQKNDTSVHESSSDKAEQLADGEAFDFDQAGYIKLGEYKGLDAQVQPEEEDIYAGMMAEAEEVELTKEDKIVKDGDLVNVDFSAKLNGEDLEEASGEDVYVRIGAGEYIDDFEKGIVGIKEGAKKTVDCKFPNDYDDADLAGKTVQFTITVNSLFSDAIANKASEGKYKTVDEYYEYEKQVQLEDNKNNKGDLVWDSLKESSEIKSVPQSMLERTRNDINQMYKNFAEMSGMSVEELLESFGMGEDGIDEIANDTVADCMIAKSIAAKEGITMDDEYYKKALWDALAYEDGDDEQTLEALEKEYVENQGSRPKDDMLIERVKDYVGEQSNES